MSRLTKTAMPLEKNRKEGKLLPSQLQRMPESKFTGVDFKDKVYGLELPQCQNLLLLGKDHLNLLKITNDQAQGTELKANNKSLFQKLKKCLLMPDTDNNATQKHIWILFICSSPCSDVSKVCRHLYMHQVMETTVSSMQGNLKAFKGFVLHSTDFEFQSSIVFVTKGPPKDLLQTIGNFLHGILQHDNQINFQCFKVSEDKLELEKNYPESYKNFVPFDSCDSCTEMRVVKSLQTHPIFKTPGDMPVYSSYNQALKVLEEVCEMKIWELKVSHVSITQQLPK